MRKLTKRLGVLFLALALLLAWSGDADAWKPGDRGGTGNGTREGGGGPTDGDMDDFPLVMNEQSEARIDPEEAPLSPYAKLMLFLARWL